MSNVVSGGAVLTKTKRVFLASGTAHEGYGVCYNWDAVGVTAENDALSVNTAITDWCDARRVQVEVPSYENHMHFAGVVDNASDGVVGPNWILIHEPGSVCPIHATITAEPRNTTTATKNSGEMLTFAIAINSVGAADTINGMFDKAGLPGRGSAIVLESEASASALVMAELLDGPPSGGTCIVPVITTMVGVTCIIHGRVILSTHAAAAGAASIAVADGTFVGQRLIFEVDATTVATANIKGTFATPNLSAEYRSAAPHISAGVAALDADDDFLDIEWNGVFWVVKSADMQVT